MVPIDYEVSGPVGGMGISAPNGGVWHCFNRGIVVLFPRMLLGPLRELVLLNLYSDDNVLLESWEAERSDDLRVDHLSRYFGEYVASFSPSYKKCRESRLL